MTQKIKKKDRRKKHLTKMVNKGLDDCDLFALSQRVEDLGYRLERHHNHIHRRGDVWHVELRVQCPIFKVAVTRTTTCGVKPRHIAARLRAELGKAGEDPGVIASSILAEMAWEQLGIAPPAYDIDSSKLPIPGCSARKWSLSRSLRALPGPLQKFYKRFVEHHGSKLHIPEDSEMCAGLLRLMVDEWRAAADLNDSDEQMARIRECVSGGHLASAYIVLHRHDREEEESEVMEQYILQHLAAFDEEELARVNEWPPLGFALYQRGADDGSYIPVKVDLHGGGTEGAESPDDAEHTLLEDDSLGRWSAVLRAPRDQ